jgi:hypothetical protein
MSSSILSPRNRCDQDIVSTFNSFLDRCKTSFNVICVSMLDIEWADKIAIFASQNKLCHTVQQEDFLAILAIDKNTKEIASYISFTSITGSHESTYINSIVFELSCTIPKYERKGLSVLLRLLVITYAIKMGFKSVVSMTNEMSGPLLQNKFGFEVLPDDACFLPELMVSGGLVINARLKLEDIYLDKYKMLYKNMSECRI